MSFLMGVLCALSRLSAHVAAGLLFLLDLGAHYTIPLLAGLIVALAVAIACRESTVWPYLVWLVLVVLTEGSIARLRMLWPT